MAKKKHQALVVRFPPDLHHALKIVSEATGESINDMVVKAVAQDLSVRSNVVQASIHEHYSPAAATSGSAIVNSTSKYVRRPIEALP